jgi:flagellar assembly factor FliW
MPVCESKYHGSIRFEPEQVLHLPAGLFGFPDETEFLLLEVPSTRPLAFVQSVRTQGLCFISLPAQVVTPDYRLELGPEDMRKLGYSVDMPPVMGRDVLCLALLTIRENQVTTANLLAPLVIDIVRHRGVQSLSQAGYSHQHAIPAMEWERVC